MHFAIKVVVLTLSTCIAVHASAQNAQLPAVQTPAQQPSAKAETQPAAKAETQPGVNQSGTADKNDNCQSIMNLAQIKVLSDDQKASLARCVSERGFSGNGEIAKAVQNAVGDITHGPGPNNDIVGRKGWLRSRLGF